MASKTEKAIFESFYETLPDFAGTKVTCREGDDPPDFVCTETNGKLIGVELVSWLDEAHMARGKKRERSRDSFVPVLQESRKLKPPSNFRAALLCLKEDPILQEDEVSSFLNELLALVQKIDDEWSDHPEWHDPPGHFVTQFDSALLGKYLIKVDFPQGQATGIGYGWIDFWATGGFYSDQTARDALKAIIRKKTGKYGDLHASKNLNELYLLIHYDQAWFYNPPFETLDFRFADAARVGTALFQEDPGQFQRAFLFNSLDQETHVIWPP